MTFRNSGHRVANRGRVRGAVALGAVAAAPVLGVALTSTTAHAAGSHDWNRIAQCESGGKWSTDTGNGYSGGLQFSPSTWSAYGGDKYAPSAAQASKSEQIAVASKVQQAQGWNAWPNCSKKAGASGAAPSAQPQNNTKRQQPQAQNNAKQQRPQQQPADRSQQRQQPRQQTQQPPRTGSGDYTVTSGDTLGSIAASHGTSWQHVYQNNKQTVGDDPGQIFPGQHLKI